MKKIIFVFLLILPFLGCEKKDNNEADYRNPYIGIFNFTTIKRTIVMCNDSSPECIDGWRILNCDTTQYISSISKNDTERIKIQFGDDIIGVDDNDSIINQTIFPIISKIGDLTLPEYPKGGHNKFEGSYIGYDTIKINLQFGYQIGGYDEYEIIGIRDN